MTMPVKLASITTLLMDAIHLYGLALKLVVVKLAASVHLIRSAVNK